MNTPDEDTVIRALEDARRILSEYFTSSSTDAVGSLERLLVVLNREEVVHALDRVKLHHVIRLAKETRMETPPLP